MKIFNYIFFLVLLLISFFVMYGVYINYKEGLSNDKKTKSEMVNSKVVVEDSSKSKKEDKNNKDKLLSPKSPILITPKKDDINLTKALNDLNATLGDRVFLRIFKSEKILEVWIKPKKSKKYRLLKSYDICTYSGGLGPKLKEGDMKSPEGFYKVYRGSLNPNSRFHLSFNLGFPNRYDRSHKRSGSYLMVHGECASIGCYAMGNKNIEEIYKLVKEALFNGQKYVDVHIFPFKMEKLNDYRGDEWFSFWSNLKQGYEAFEKSKIPPLIGVKDGLYTINKR